MRFIIVLFSNLLTDETIHLANLYLLDGKLTLNWLPPRAEVKDKFLDAILLCLEKDVERCCSTDKAMKIIADLLLSNSPYSSLRYVEL